MIDESTLFNNIKKPSITNSNEDKKQDSTVESDFPGLKDKDQNNVEIIVKNCSLDKSSISKSKDNRLNQVR